MPDHNANYKTQDRGFAYLADALPGFYAPNGPEKLRLLELLGVSKRFKQTFDAVRLNVKSISDVQSAKDFDLLEIKSTDKCLPDLPKGFFFGLTENEEMLLKVFQDKYFLCLVCLNSASIGHKLVGWTELQPLIQHKRVQYQINLQPSKKKTLQ